MPAKCPVCGAEFDEDRLSFHVQTDHPSYGSQETEARRLQSHRCAFCGVGLATPEELKAHHLSAHQR